MDKNEENKGDDADNAPLLSGGRPSDNWPPFSDSDFKEKYVTEASKKIRTMTPFMTLANILKMYVGIAFISTPKSVQQAGLYGFILVVIFILISTIWSIFLIIKARNRFKRDDKIIDLVDLGVKLYGEGIRIWMQILVILTNTVVLIMYTMFFGTTVDKLMCKTLEVAECRQNKIYTSVVLVVIFPILLIRRLQGIGVFSAIALAFTFFAIIVILIVSGMILSKD